MVLWRKQIADSPHAAPESRTSSFRMTPGFRWGGQRWQGESGSAWWCQRKSCPSLCLSLAGSRWQFETNKKAKKEKQGGGSLCPADGDTNLQQSVLTIHRDAACVKREWRRGFGFKRSRSNQGLRFLCCARKKVIVFSLFSLGHPRCWPVGLELLKITATWVSTSDSIWRKRWATRQPSSERLSSTGMSCLPANCMRATSSSGRLWIPTPHMESPTSTTLHCTTPHATPWPASFGK